ncbi:hypothetical protein [Curtobacterium caseinilyticum]|uniref:Uncharacterized protein n=1 Tax=Curtobacterium caseinilyticum TaxID=3055137 RepID=A0ABT7TPA6_9MICO|nr:hypothetical protein [Curtobacterium caseinilyticum]MDM7891428.1 hypothetical protein [Curtobacterium caseinilyticum]
MSRRRSRPVKQLLPLLALVLGLVASAIGERIGQPNSWLWFGGGVVVAVVWAVLVRRNSRMR